MEWLVIGLAAAFASMLTFFSGFGLGTILLPVFALFFPVEMAVALTGVVHLLNNLFKMTLVGKYARWSVVLRFGIPAVLGAFLGAQLLLYFSGTEPLYTYSMRGSTFEVQTVKLIVAALMVFFALFEILPKLKQIQFSKDKLLFGGLLSGFFGGLSGHQGALRSAFLLRFGLTKEVFIATGIFISAFIDITRLSVYFSRMQQSGLTDNWQAILAGVIPAFAGAYIGRQLLKKITMDFIQWTVAILIIFLAVGLALGWI
jgi:uncharacterized membrane protein YfcA